MTPLTNPTLFAFIFATAFGVVMHDSQVDHAASVAITTPTFVSSYAAADAVSKSSEHVHVERVSIMNQGNASRNAPRTLPRDNDRRYIQTKKVALHTGNGAGLWPSA